MFLSMLPLELIYNIVDYLDYPLLYLKYLLPNQILPYKYKLDYINSIEKPMCFPSGCIHYFSAHRFDDFSTHRVDDFKLLFKEPIFDVNEFLGNSIFDSIFEKDSRIFENIKGFQHACCETSRNEYKSYLSANYSQSILYEIFDKSDTIIFEKTWEELKKLI